jgi:short-subunit dehydrogenase
MIQNGKGRILNVASTAGIQPDPYFAVYGASKAYVISLTEAIHKEFEKTGVTATVLSPGATKTEFMERADMNNAKLYDQGVMTAKEVARVGFNGMMKGKLHVIPGLKNKILAFFSSITPSSKIRLNIAANVMATKQLT